MTKGFGFLAGQIARVLDRIGALDDKLAVLIGMATRHHDALTGYAAEFRGLVEAVSCAADQR